ncbi:unnamed protein product [Clonostachys chloroleuca]|uniref:aldehyde dehydrogenase (NAD(+)) n=1 Tax=Clonostachys chloroleuca TaxID=1926264 RepID=A0AA35MCX4_9HYPO|nr:unnamed protein product [Clonostachys chloroleuca]
MDSQTCARVKLPDGTTYEQPTGIFISNEFRKSHDKTVIDSINPYTQLPIASIARGKLADVNAAVAAAKSAFSGWRDTSPQDRAKLLSKLANLIERDVETLAKIESIDGGKPVHIAKGADVLASSACIRYYSGWADKLKGDTIETDPDTLNITIIEPLGVCGLIIPWNFPLLITCWKLGPALAAGNTVVIKPAELTSLSALYLAKLVVEAGFPPGVVNVVTGLGNEAGQALTEHPDVKKISFTGSTPVGKVILKTSADTNLKKVTLELGGKSPSIVFDDADLDQVIEAVNGGIFYNMGQNCCASSRVYVQESIYEDFLKRFAARARRNKSGDPFDNNTFLGPQIDGNQHSKIMGMIQRAKSDGVGVVTGGTSPDGWFIEPTIFRDVKSSAEIMQQEVFGPVVAVAPFKDIHDVLEKAHDTIYGLAAAVFTSDIKRGIRLSKMLQAGSVWVNNYNMISHALPFGGYGQSGNGKDLGSEGIEGYTQLKTVRFMYENLAKTTQTQEGIMSHPRQERTDPLGKIQSLSLIECGEDAAKHFLHDTDYINLNHGSYGTYPREIRDILRYHQDRAEARPDDFVRYQYRVHLLRESREVLAEYLDIPAECCVYIPNASTGIDTILHNFDYKPGDVIIGFPTIYDSYESTAKYLSEVTPAEFKKIEYTYPVSDNFICQTFEDTVKKLLQAGKKPKVALFDTISSLPGLRMPFERLTELCRSYNVLSLIDGAHGVGMIPLHLQQLDPDFLVSNCHKWLYTPRSCAFLYVPIRNQHLLKITFPTGFGFLEFPKDEDSRKLVPNNFIENFADLNTRDDTPYLCVRASLEWRKKLVWKDKQGEEAIMSYLYYLAEQAGSIFAAALGTEVLSRGTTSMTNVRLPLAMDKITGGVPSNVGEVSRWVMKEMMEQYGTAINLTFYNGALWIRLSAQIYLTVQDLEVAAGRLKIICDTASQRTWNFRSF